MNLVNDPAALRLVLRSCRLRSPRVDKDAVRSKIVNKIEEALRRAKATDR